MSPRSHRVKGTLGLDPWSRASGLSELMGEREPYQLMSMYALMLDWHIRLERSPVSRVQLCSLPELLIPLCAFLTRSATKEKKMTIIIGKKIVC